MIEETRYGLRTSVPLGYEEAIEKTTAALKAQDRYERLLAALGRVIPYDAAALLRFDGSFGTGPGQIAPSDTMPTHRPSRRTQRNDPSGA